MENADGVPLEISVHAVDEIRITEVGKLGRGTTHVAELEIG